MLRPISSGDLLSGDKTPALHKPASLLGLPREIRDEIYQYALYKPQTTITMLSDFYAFHSEISAVQPALTSTNRQIRHESLRVFYAENSFLAEVCSRLDLDAALRWLEAIGDENIAHLRSLSVCGWSRVQIGDASVRQWIRADLDLKYNDFHMRAPAEEGHPRLTTRVGELKTALRNMFESRGGTIHNVASIGRLLKSFHFLCVDPTSYVWIDTRSRFADDDGSVS